MNGQLRVFETATNIQRMATSINEPENNQTDDEAQRRKAPQITCFAWKPTQQQDKKRKRLKKHVDPHILVGFASGQIGLVSVNSETTQYWKADADQHAGSIRSVAWHASAGYAFSCDSKGVILKWAFDGSQCTLFRDKMKGTKVLCPGLPTPKNRQTILCGGRDIRVLRIKDAVEIKRISAHVTPTSNLVLSTRSDFPAVISYVSNDENDRQVNIWSLSLEDKKQRLILSIEAPAPPIDVTISHDQKQHKTGTARIAVIARDGKAYIYEGSSGVIKSPNACVSILTGDVPTKGVRILSALFPIDRSEDQLRIARGNAIDPSFEDVTLGSKLEDKVLTRNAPLDLFQPLGKSKSEKTPKTKVKQKPTILGLAQVSKGTKKNDDEPFIKMVEEDMKADGLPQGYTRDGQPKSGTLTNMLLQALNSGDQALLDECLSSSNERVVKATVARLPMKAVVPFFKKIVHKLEARPSRALSLLLWVRSILSAHTSHLITLPGLSGILKDLYGMAEARLAALPSLSRLSGRLDLLLAQADRLNRADSELAAADDEIIPLSVYIEPDEDEDEDGSPTNNSSDEDDDDDGDEEDMNEWASLEVHGEDDALFDDVLGISELEDDDNQTDEGSDNENDDISNNEASDEEGTAMDDDPDEEDSDVEADQGDDDGSDHREDGDDDDNDE
eukprot:gene590-3904_t